MPTKTEGAGVPETGQPASMQMQKFSVVIRIDFQKPSAQKNMWSSDAGASRQR